MRLLLVALLLCPALVLGQPTNADVAFWAWFGQHRAQIAATATDTTAQKEQTYNEIVQALRQVHPGLAFEVGRMPDGRTQFIVSADGIREYFPFVQQLVAALPPGGWDGWNITAFRPRIGTEYSITINGLTVAPKDVWFRAATNDDGKVQLQLYVRGWNPTRNTTTLRTAVDVLVDAALGEYDAHTRLGTRDFFPLMLNPQRYGLSPFSDLPATVDRLAKQK